MESYQSSVAPVAPQLTVAADSWARMQLSNPQMQTFAHALAAELYASLRAPKFDACAFVNGIAQHHFSLAWAQNSKYGKIASHFWSELSAAGNRASGFWAYIQSPRIQSMHLLTKAQLADLANLPGEIS
jgi:hypothetical protein